MQQEVLFSRVLTDCMGVFQVKNLRINFQYDKLQGGSKVYKYPRATSLVQTRLPYFIKIYYYLNLQAIMNVSLYFDIP